TNTAQNYANVYAGVGKPESIAKSQQELANEAVVNSTPFGFANALFEGQLTPQLSNKIVSKQPNPSLFALQTADFLNPRIGSPAQGTEIKSEITPVTPSSVGSAFAGAIASSPGSAPFDNSGILPSPSAGSQMPGQSGSFNDPSNPSNSGTSQNPQNNPPLLGGGGAGDNGSSPGGSSSGILSQLEDFVSKHPIIVAAIIIGTVILVTGGKRR
ncbi:MAG: hypothetical protein KGI08_05455, partial [Thaumarchaeota archaeon]|nr:hypothetical protein [Nitrososphaerota archaeon]